MFLSAVKPDNVKPNMVIKEFPKEAPPIQLIGKINETQVECNLDTSAHHNYINKVLAEKINLTKKKSKKNS